MDATKERNSKIDKANDKTEVKASIEQSVLALVPGTDSPEKAVEVIAATLQDYEQKLAAARHFIKTNL